MASIDIGIDLGTANIIISTASKGVILNEPSVVAYDKKKEKVVAVGNDAYKMIGRTPEYIIAVRPLRDGVISDYNMTQSLIKQFILKVTGKRLIRPRIVMCVPTLVTEIESKAVIEAALAAGARKVFIIEEPVAAMIGAGIDITKPDGNMVVDIGGGTVDIAVISLGGIVKSTSVKVAGSKIDAAIIKYIASNFHVLIGEKTAENIKIEIANVYEPSGLTKIMVKGRNLVSGLPQKIEVSEIDVFESIKDCVFDIISGIKKVCESTDPELLGDIYNNGIILTGGGALLKGLDKLIESQINVKCRVADSPLYCVARGTVAALQMPERLRDGFEQVSLYRK